MLFSQSQKKVPALKPHCQNLWPESLNIDLDSCNLSRSPIQELKRFLVSFSDLFASPTGTLGRTSVVKHAIQTDGPPVKQQLRRMPEALKAAVKEEVQKMLNQGVVRPSSSPWSSPTVLVRKKNGTWRFCVDYHKVNSMTRRDAYPLPRIDATLDALAGAQYFTTLVASGVGRGCQREDRFFNVIWPLRVQCHAIWSDQCPTNISEAHGLCPGRDISRAVPHIC